MAVTLARWEREELDAALSAALNGSRKPSRDSAQRALELIEAAEAAGREWPALFRDGAAEDKCFTMQKGIAKRESVVLVTHDGKPIGKSTRVGRSRRRADGSWTMDQALFSEMTWDEVAAWAGLILGQIEGLKPNLTMVNRVLELRVAVPQSVGPGDAATSLGTTVGDWIEAAS